jgi:lipopolysaccharide export LptBFGC system permease protein LptF
MAKAKRKTATKKKGGGVWFSIVVLIVGILFLLADLGIWDLFYGIAGWTAFFILAGVWMLFVRK